MATDVLRAGGTTHLVLDLHSALPELSRARIRDVCELITAEDELDRFQGSMQATLLVVAAVGRVAEALRAAHEMQRRLPAGSRVTVGVAGTVRTQDRNVQLVELDTSPGPLRNFLLENESATPPLELASPLVGRSERFLHVVRELERASAAPSNVLITGESGTGKELAAQLIHARSRRAGKPVVCINCAAIPDTLLESELFGYQKGAFTGADHTEDGAFARAHQGTLVLDEIGDMSQVAQAKLLRVLETKRVCRLGSRVETPADARIVSLTNRSLDAMVQNGTFRGDLFFRLNVVHVEMPPLRERLEDLPELVHHFTRILGPLFRTKVEGVSEEVLAKFRLHHWPGNVREFRNVMEAAFVNRPGRLIELDHLPRHFLKQTQEVEREQSCEELTRILSALNECQWNKSRAADKLKWSRMTLYRKMARYQLVEPEPNRALQRAV